MKPLTLILALAFLLEPAEYACDSAPHWSCGEDKPAIGQDYGYISALRGAQIAMGVW